MMKYKVTKTDYPEFPTVLSLKCVCVLGGGVVIELRGPLC